jgi:deferrochelatase/peroxidase EfeB
MEAMNSRFGQDALHDPDRSEWEPAFQRDIHAMVLLAHDDVEALNRAVATVSRDVSAIAQVSTECGQRLSKGGASIEHFGYRDAVSQPIFFEDDLPPARASFDPSAGPSLVLARDPLGASDRSCGSYLVFRKIDQEEEEKRAAALARRNENAPKPGARPNKAKKKKGAVAAAESAPADGAATDVTPEVSLTKDVDAQANGNSTPTSGPG